ncbi:YkgJ family cysteine cluster protein [Candidatus Woesearchaeota archaeon]|nr:YkgJ family cysteine cluster protein [Candidatus Woesearchaeota archaeon]
MQLKVIQPEPKFSCSQCGSCCSKIRGMMPREDKEFLEKMAYGKMPLIQLVPLEQMTFPLYDWEAKRFKKWQHEAGIDGKIKPSRAILDLNTNTAIIVTYFMDSDACPFLKDNKCSIYYTKRAYVCRLFPFNRGPFLDTGEKASKENMFGTCGAMESVMPHIPENYTDMVKFLNGAFPDGSFGNAVQHDIVIEWVNKTIVALIKKRLIRPAMNYPYDFLVKRISNAEKIDFTDFLVKSNYFSSGEMENLIKRFDNNSDAKEKIEEFIKNN